ncbi:MAG: prepilin peptidase CpaA [Verrucomicrobia bacterium]|nr:MAG: prepilin peptidase CpaA [Verrucomicrobiota bacterium]
MSVLHTLLMLAFPALVIVAALKDLTSFTIPNWISLALAAAFVPAALTGAMPWPEFGLHWAVGLGALVAGMVMFALGWIGGGDAKLFAASGLWIGTAAFLPYILVTALAGGGLAVLLVSIRHSYVRAIVPAGPAWVERLRQPKGDAPYGVAIAIGALCAGPLASQGLFALG